MTKSLTSSRSESQSEQIAVAVQVVEQGSKTTARAESSMQPPTVSGSHVSNASVICC